MHMLSARISSWRVRSVHASDPYAHAQHVLKGGPFQIWNFYLMLSIRVRNWCICSGTHQFLTRMLSAHISSWHECSVYVSVSDSHAQRTRQFLTRMLRVFKMNIWKTDAHAEHTRKELMRMVRVRISSCRAHSVCAQFLIRMLSVRTAHKGRSMRVRNSIFSINVEVPKSAKIL
jgi:hypothetical protein